MIQSRPCIVDCIQTLHNLYALHSVPSSPYRDKSRYLLDKLWSLCFPLCFARVCEVTPGFVSGSRAFSSVALCVNLLSVGGGGLSLHRCSFTAAYVPSGLVPCLQPHARRVRGTRVSPVLNRSCVAHRLEGLVAAGTPLDSDAFVGAETRRGCTIRPQRLACQGICVAQLSATSRSANLAQPNLVMLD
jgi:hypothetical protein